MVLILVPGLPITMLDPLDDALAAGSDEGDEDYDGK